MKRAIGALLAAALCMGFIMAATDGDGHYWVARKKSNTTHSISVAGGRTAHLIF